MTGEWFKWLSADDVLKEDAIEKLVSEIKLLGNTAKNCIIYSHYDLIDESGKVIDLFEEPNINSLDKFQKNVILLDHFYGNGTTSIIHKSVFEKCGNFDENVGYKDDYEFWLRCCLLYDCEMHLLPQNIAKYRIHSNQLTKKRYDDALEQIETIKSQIFKKLSPSLRSKYVSALKKYQKQKPIRTRIKKFTRDIMFKILPKRTSKKILETYLNKKSNF